MNLQTLAKARPGLWVLGLAGLVGLTACVEAPPVQPRPLYEHERPRPQPAADSGPSLYFYPERGQSEAQLDRDRYECYRWAVQQTGVDPGMTVTRAPRSTEPAGPSGAGVAMGGITGAAVGGALSGPRHGGEGMVLGAIFGAMLGASAEQAQAQRRDERRAAAEARAQVPLDNFRRAMSACMGGRGYRVS